MSLKVGVGGLDDGGKFVQHEEAVTGKVLKLCRYVDAGTSLSGYRSFLCSE